jgi:hypothetical protein
MPRQQSVFLETCALTSHSAQGHFQDTGVVSLAHRLNSRHALHESTVINTDPQRVHQCEVIRKGPTPEDTTLAGLHTSTVPGG